MTKAGRRRSTLAVPRERLTKPDSVIAILKEHTIIFVPHARAKFRKWRFTTLRAALLLAVLAVLTVGGGVSTYLYFDARFDRQILDDIQQENAELRRVNQGFERSIRGLSEQLSTYQEKIRQLAIVAGVAELSPASEAGIGGPMTIETNPELSSSLARLDEQVNELGHDVSVLKEHFEDRRLRISSTPSIAPVKGLLTSRYGYRADPFTKKRTFHGGIDINAPRGKGVQVTGEGIVTRTGRMRGLGNAVYVSHGFGVTTRYGHLTEIKVEEGQRLRRGDIVGTVGNTGRSTGYHLHYEVRVDNRPVDPLGYILDDTSP